MNILDIVALHSRASVFVRTRFASLYERLLTRYTRWPAFETCVVGVIGGVREET